MTTSVDHRPDDMTPATYSTDSTSTSLLVRVKARDAMAWRRLVDLYSPLAFSWCQRNGLSREDSSDALQEIFAAVAENIGPFRREQPGETFRGWLRVIARNKIRLHFRQQAHQPKVIGGDAAEIQMHRLADGPLDQHEPWSDGQERNELLHRALELVRGEFEDRTWRAFWGAVVQQQSSVEIAAQLQTTPGAVRQAKYKVLRRLRSELGELLD